MDSTLATIQSISQGLTAYMTYQARCGMSPAYSEYLLYDPIVRIAKNLGWQTITEYAVNKGKKKPGDYKRVDFILTRKNPVSASIVLEIKWLPRKVKALSIERDIKKIKKLLPLLKTKLRSGFVLLAGVHRLDRKGEESQLPKRITPKKVMSKHAYYQTVYQPTKTQYGVTVIAVNSPKRRK